MRLVDQGWCSVHTYAMQAGIPLTYHRAVAYSSEEHSP